jgi:hypothetical protein
MWIDSNDLQCDKELLSFDLQETELVAQMLPGEHLKKVAETSDSDDSHKLVIVESSTPDVSDVEGGDALKSRVLSPVKLSANIVPPLPAFEEIVHLQVMDGAKKRTGSTANAGGSKKRSRTKSPRSKSKSDMFT